MTKKFYVEPTSRNLKLRTALLAGSAANNTDGTVIPVGEKPAKSFDAPERTSNISLD
ncbi:MAG: hypothetical protein K6E54_05075 [Bacteroidaceae bacterium]|nr:hypothetical protein [Bacteroidaceae bacterium]